MQAAELTPAVFHRLVRGSEPVIIRDAARLAEFRKISVNWRNRTDLVRKYGDSEVVQSYSTSTVFEGVELASQWPGAQRFWEVWSRESSKNLPAEVLSTPGSMYRPCKRAGDQCLRHILDRVVVRPAKRNLTLRSALLDNLPAGAESAYVQYESIPAAMLQELTVPDFAKALLPEFEGLWMGRGHTVAQLHHDANENLLLLLRGRKRWRLFPPSAGDFLREGYMLEVQSQLRTDSDSNSTKQYLEQSPVGLSNASLSFFTSPVKLPSWGTSPSHRDFRAFKMLTCEVSAGDMLYVPAWWWHQVETNADIERETAETAHENQAWSSAINFWFVPYYVKPFGCAGCSLRRNTNYYKLPL